MTVILDLGNFFQDTFLSVKIKTKMSCKNISEKRYNNESRNSKEAVSIYIDVYMQE